MTRIGRAEAEIHQDIQLKGLGIANEHCIIELVEKEVYLTSVGNAKLVLPPPPPLNQDTFRLTGHNLE